SGDFGSSRRSSPGSGCRRASSPGPASRFEGSPVSDEKLPDRMNRASRICAAGVAAIFCAAGAGPAASGDARHLIFLHGRIVQERQSPRPKSEQFGYYELEKILDAFRAKGFTVSGEIRPKNATESDAADKVVAQVRRLLDSGVPASRITVVGASMGAGIAMAASARLQNPEVRFSILGACLSGNAGRIREAEGK